MLRLRGRLIQAALLLIVCSMLAVSQQPLPSRRPLTQEEVQRVLSNDGDDYKVKLMQAQGYAGNLTKSQLATFRQRGIGEMDLMMYYDEFGITPEESDAIKRAGFNIEARPFEIWHFAALSDVVCIGKVVQKKGNPQGPYHTYVDIEILEYLKNTPQSQDRILQTRILESGPRYSLKEEVVQVDAQSEPNLKVGEKVLLFLTRKTFSLILLLARAKRTDIHPIHDFKANMEQPRSFALFLINLAHMRYWVLIKLSAARLYPNCERSIHHLRPKWSNSMKPSRLS